MTQRLAPNNLSVLEGRAAGGPTASRARKQALTGEEARALKTVANAGGFSLIELLVAATIMTFLAAIGAVSYKKYKKQATESWLKGELSAISSFLDAAHLHDGGYHQFLYQLGYRPKGKQYGTVWLTSKSTGDKACCDEYPDNKGVSTCTGEYLYYQCDDSAKGKAISNLGACGKDDCPRAGNVGEGTNKTFPAALKTNPITAGAVERPEGNCQAQELHTASNSWCDCDRYTLVGLSPDKNKPYFTLNHKRIVCFAISISDKLKEL